MSRPTKQYICLVDCNRRPARQCSTMGRYQVGARDKKEAKKLLKASIGFGSLVVLCVDEAQKIILQRGQIVKEHHPGVRMLQPWETVEALMACQAEYLPVRHATAPQREVRLNV